MPVRNQWRLLTLLVISSSVSYVGRVNLSVAATDIQGELHLSRNALGILLSAFAWSYSLCQISSLSGWLADRFNPGWVLAGGFCVWSAATALTGAAHSFTAIFIFSLLLGIGQSVTPPAQTRILGSEIAERYRAFANAINDAGMKAGPALAILAGGLLLTKYGWRAFFVAQGVGSLIWLLPWCLTMPRGSRVSTANDVHTTDVRMMDILRQPAAWFTAAGLFCSNYFLFFLMTWLPSYLETERQFPKSKMALFGSLAFLTIAISGVISGWLSDLWIARGGTPTLVRKTFVGAGLALSALILPVAMVRDNAAAMLLLLLACLAFGLCASNVLAITQTLSGPRAMGRWIGLQNGCANLAGIAAPWFTGWVVGATGGFYLAFVVTAMMVLAGAAIFVIGVGPIEPVAFR